MPLRLTKLTLSCKAAIGLSALLAGGASMGDAPSGSLRDCVARAEGTAAVAICEQQHRIRLKQDIERLTTAIGARLDRQQRLVFDRSTEAWREFLTRESAMLRLSLGLRGDGLGATLQQGSITRLYEQRVQQLREHLHNLSLTPGRDT